MSNTNNNNNNARFSIPVIYVAIVAGLLLCLVTQLANSAATPADPRKDANQKGAPIRPEEPTRSDGATGKGKRATVAGKSQQTVGSNKFQARMGNDQQQQQQLGQMNHPQDPFYTSYDSWNPHSLVPTFTDAEQGDEMVALASDSEAPSSEQYIRPPSGHSNLTRSAPPPLASEGAHQQRQQGAPKQLAAEHRYPLVGMPPVAQAAAHMSPFDKQQHNGNQANANKQRQQQQHNHAQSDEYYTDDEEDEEDSIKGLRGDFESFGQQQQQDRKEIKFRAMQRPADMDGHQYTDTAEPSDPRAADQQPQQGYRIPSGPAMELGMVNNKSQVSAQQQQQTKQLGAPTPDARWLPSSDTQAGSSLNPDQPSAATSKQQFASEQQRLRDPQIQQPSGNTERVPKLFGGRGDSAPFSPFSKTDAAIEYLRNLLKTKQSSRSNNSTLAATTIPSGDLPPQATIDAPTSKQQSNAQQQLDQSENSFQRLSSFASKLSQMLNSTSSAQPLVGPSQNFSAATEIGKLDYLSPYPNQDQGAGAGRFMPLMVGQQQQTDTKFSVVDAKAAAAQSSSFKPVDGLYQTKSRTISTSSTTSKPPQQSHFQLSDEPRKHPQPELPIFQAEPSKPEPYSQEPLSPVNTPNGTPLGGDYIESLDDFPRGQRQQQVFPSESRLVPVQIQQDSKAQPEQAAELVGETGGPGQSIKLVDQAAGSEQSKQLPAINQINPLHFDRESFEAFQRQISGVPSSSHYFQMHKPQPEADHPSNSNINNRQPEGKLVSSADTARGQPAKDETQITEHSKPANHHHHHHHHQQQQQQDAHYSEPALANDNQAKKSQSLKMIDEQKRQQVIAHHERPKQNMGPAVGQEQQRPAISSKIYPNDQHQRLSPQLLDLHQQHQAPYTHPQPHPQSAKQPPVATPVPDAAPSSHHLAQPESQKIKPPKIVSYNYFESPNEAGESELMTTNYQLGDTLYSSAGGAEQTLSNAELEAIQNQFLTAEHPLVHVDSHVPGDQTQFGKHHHHHQHNNHPRQVQASSQHEQDQSLTGLLASLKPNLQPDMLQKLSSPANQMEEAMKELASNGDLVSVAAPPPSTNMFKHHQQQLENGPVRANEEVRGPSSGVGGISKNVGADPMKNKKSLIVYLNHPRPTDMSKVSSSPDETYSLSQTIGDPQSEPFVAAKEFDIHGLSKAPKHLDISNLRDSLQDSKDGKDKDGLSVVVIGDAYKYKKIVLLISSKSGGLKFIPMVKDMKKKK